MTYYIRDAHGIIIGRYDTREDALFNAKDVLEGFERVVLTVEGDGETYTGRLIGEVSKNETPTKMPEMRQGNHRVQILRGARQGGDPGVSPQIRQGAF